VIWRAISRHDTRRNKEHAAKRLKNRFEDLGFAVEVRPASDAPVRHSIAGGAERSHERVRRGLVPAIGEVPHRRW
jgi:hypothetical protein